MREVLRFARVAFRYQEDSPWVLRGVSFSLAQGQWLALMGESGAGKSTIARLACGLAAPSMGEVAAARAAYVAQGPEGNNSCARPPAPPERGWLVVVPPLRGARAPRRGQLMAPKILKPTSSASESRKMWVLLSGLKSAAPWRGKPRSTRPWMLSGSPGRRSGA